MLNKEENLKNHFTVFTYGTLMKNFEGYDKFMRHCRFIGKGYINGFLYHTFSGYPAVIPDEENGEKVFGELYEVDTDTMKEIRRYEGVNSFLTCYEERTVNVTFDGKKAGARAFTVTASREFLVKLTSRLVKYGDWRHFLNNSGRRRSIVT